MDDIRVVQTEDRVILNTEPGAWAFDEHARRLSSALRIPVSPTPAKFNYVMAWEEGLPLPRGRSFIPFEGMRLASDKRLLAECFLKRGVPTPQTYLVEERSEVWSLVEQERSVEWCLKWPISCGGSGHRLIITAESVPEDWPRPYVVQEFIRLEVPAVFRTYAAGGEIFGWNVRKFPAGVLTSEWVAHARGARYVVLDRGPEEAIAAARRALEASVLIDSFGCVDLIQRVTGEWVVLEVGTDGIYNHVDREIGNEAFERELDERVAGAFWKWVSTSPF